jgi:branched-chain amino acid transport system substrate-binding protein
MAGPAIRAAVLCTMCMLGAPARADSRIGIAGPETGRNQFTGEQQLIGAQKVVDILNATGGVRGEEIVSVPVDDACDARQAEAAARQLIAEPGIVMITPGSTNPKVTDEGPPSTFRIIGRDDQQGAVIGTYLAGDEVIARAAPAGGDGEPCLRTPRGV